MIAYNVILRSTTLLYIMSYCVRLYDLAGLTQAVREHSAVVLQVLSEVRAVQGGMRGVHALAGPAPQNKFSYVNILIPTSD